MALGSCHATDDHVAESIDAVRCGRSVCAIVAPGVRTSSSVIPKSELAVEITAISVRGPLRTDNENVVGSTSKLGDSDMTEHRHALRSSTRASQHMPIAKREAAPVVRNHRSPSETNGDQVPHLNTANLSHCCWRQEI